MMIVVVLSSKVPDQWYNWEVQQLGGTIPVGCNPRVYIQWNNVEKKNPR
jgi:hypothetical protein